jgi:flagellar capping protein FliD
MKKFLLILFTATMAGIPDASAGLLQQQVSVVPVAEKVSIEGGIVFVNGKKVDESSLPTGLRDLSSEVNMTFWTADNALIEINGATFFFENGTFREADPSERSERNVMVMFSSEDNGANVRLYEAPVATTNYMVRGRNQETEVMRSYVAQLREQAEQFNQLTFKFKEVAPETNEIARQMVVEAENTARLASVLPRVEYEAYLGSLQNQNQRLYQELMREREMEMRTHQLAQAIHQTETADQRAAHERELRQVLTEIFELKQANREKEIEELDKQLKDLQSRLDDRESLKEDIIESRLNDLLNLHRW